MNRRFLSLVALSTAAAAFAGQVATPLATWAQKVNALKSVQADVVLTAPGQPSQTYTVTLQKPSNIKVDSETETVFADGKTVTVYDKPKNFFYTRPQTDAELRRLLQPDQYALFRSFFDEKAFEKAQSRLGQSRTISGEKVQPIDVALDRTSKKTFTFYVGPDGLVRKAERTMTTPQGKKVAVLTAKNVSLDADLGAEAFAFKAPEGAAEIKYADLEPSRWFTDLDEAKTIADKTGRRIFIDFMSPRAGASMQMAQELFVTEDFKALGKRFVFVRINADDQQTVAQAFRITAVPTQIIASADGTEIARNVGYDGVNAFFEFIDGLGTR